MKPKSVGIIANPDSGKDIRRLVAYGSVFNNNEKISIIKRILMALDALRVKNVIMMPDHFGLGLRALDDLNISIEAHLLDMTIEGNQNDSMRAAAMLDELGVACIITLGGDGTNRMVAKACGDIPLLPISTGTNNVFPFMIEGTLAGMAAGILATRSISRKASICRMPVLEVCRDGKIVDIALIDIVVTDDAYIGARAVWEIDSLIEVFLSRNAPSCIGFSSLAAILNRTPKKENTGTHIVIGPGGKEVMAPIAPGKIERLPIASHRLFTSREEIALNTAAGGMIALDGEREIVVNNLDKLTVRYNPNGPWVVDVDRVLSVAAENNYLDYGN